MISFLFLNRNLSKAWGKTRGAPLSFLHARPEQRLWNEKQCGDSQLLRAASQL